MVRPDRLRRLERAVRLVVAREERLDLGPQPRVVTAGLRDVARPLSGGELARRREDGSSALVEARSRAKNMRIRVNFYEGDIRDCPNRKHDIVCYNFSLHYIFATKELFHESIREIRKRVKPGGYLAGIIPDSEKIVFKTPLVDDRGNFFKLREHGNGGFGEKLFVHLADTPFYADGPRSEPVAYKDLLVTHLEDAGFTLLRWEGLEGNPISELYSKFIFVYSKR